MPFCKCLAFLSPVLKSCTIVSINASEQWEEKLQWKIFWDKFDTASTVTVFTWFLWTFLLFCVLCDLEYGHQKSDVTVVKTREGEKDGEERELLERQRERKREQASGVWLRCLIQVMLWSNHCSCRWPLLVGCFIKDGCAGLLSRT